MAPVWRIQDHAGRVRWLDGTASPSPWALTFDDDHHDGQAGEEVRAEGQLHALISFSSTRRSHR